MTALARFKTVILSWAGATLIFTAVLEISGHGHKPLGFALYSNAVHFALWALVLPLFTQCIRRFPLKDPKRIWNAGIRLILIAVLAMLVTLAHWAIIFPTYFPYRSSYPTFHVVLRSELLRFLPNEILIGIVLVTAIEAWHVLLDLQAEAQLVLRTVSDRKSPHPGDWLRRSRETSRKSPPVRGTPPLLF